MEHKKALYCMPMDSGPAMLGGSGSVSGVYILPWELCTPETQADYKAKYQAAGIVVPNGEELLLIAGNWGAGQGQAGVVV
jgi:hypothetical protein